MSAIQGAYDALAAAVRVVPRVRVYDDLGANVDPPAIIVGPPRVAPDAYTGALSAATFVVALIVPADDRALGRLYELLPGVCAAIHDGTDGVVLSADPGVWRVGNSELPAYLIETEVPLT